MKQKTNTTLDEAISSVKQNILSTINCHGVGKVLEFNSSNMSATVEYTVLDDFNGLTVYESIIEDVPILFVGNKNIRFTFNPVGANCLLCFLDRNFDKFFETGQAYFPATSRKHSVSDCIAICTFNCDIDDVPEYDEDDLSISNKNGNIVLYTGASDKIKVYNDKQNLKTILTNLVSAIEAITVQGNGIDSKTALENVKTAIGELLE